MKKNDLVRLISYPDEVSPPNISPKLWPKDEWYKHLYIIGKTYRVLEVYESTPHCYLRPNEILLVCSDTSISFWNLPFFYTCNVELVKEDKWD